MSFDHLEVDGPKPGEDHRRWLVVAKTFKLKLEVLSGVVKEPRWDMCLTYDFEVRKKGFPLYAALVRSDQQHRTHQIAWMSSRKLTRLQRSLARLQCGSLQLSNSTSTA